MNEFYICMPRHLGETQAKKDFDDFLKAEEGLQMNAVDMRDWVKSAYPGPNWKKKVDKMPDDQIIALYYSLVKQGKIKN